jgi:hypothetical protein
LTLFIFAAFTGVFHMFDDNLVVIFCRARRVKSRQCCKRIKRAFIDSNPGTYVLRHLPGSTLIRALTLHDEEFTSTSRREKDPLSFHLYAMVCYSFPCCNIYCKPALLYSCNNYPSITLTLQKAPSIPSAIHRTSISLYL